MGRTTIIEKSVKKNPTTFIYLYKEPLEMSTDELAALLNCMFTTTKYRKKNHIKH